MVLSLLRLCPCVLFSHSYVSTDLSCEDILKISISNCPVDSFPHVLRIFKSAALFWKVIFLKFLNIPKIFKYSKGYSEKNMSPLSFLPVFSSFSILPRRNHCFQFLGAFSRAVLIIINWVCESVCVSLSTVLSNLNFPPFCLEEFNFWNGLFLFGGKVMFCFCQIRTSESGLSRSWAISDFPKHLVLVALSCN
jgi:hypothetical protein